jgi:hypothetical protein
VGAKGQSRDSTTAEPPSLSGSPSDHGSVLVAAALATLVDCGRGRDTVLTDNTTEDTILANCEVVRRG